MTLISQMLFCLSIFLIFWAMIGYPTSILLIDKILKPNENTKDYTHLPTVTVMVVAHNEELVIKEKLNNIIRLDYPIDRISFLVTSDNSTDMTNEIVEQFISDNPNFDIKLYKAQKRMGKLNAQNEGQKIVETEYLVMTDANSMLESQSIKELMASFSSDDISYVTGRLVYTNAEDNNTSHSESTYWNLDVTVRNIESKLQTITAGNGALYAVRNDRYVHFNPIEGHDYAMPLHYSLKNERALMNSKAVVYEKSGETIEDEFGRKVRMNRRILNQIIPDKRILNIFKYKWFSFFYFGHRTCRYLLWASHIVLLFSSGYLALFNKFFIILFVFQVIFYIIGILAFYVNFNSRIINVIHYYCVTIWAQVIGVYRILTGQVKPFWEKAESTR